MANPEAMKAAREMFHGCTLENCRYCTQAAETIDRFARERVLAEAKWWRHLVVMHEESYFAVEGDKRIKQIEERT